MVYRFRNRLVFLYANPWWVMIVVCDKLMSLVALSDVRRQRKHRCVSPVRIHSD